jgi:hypothetical protein
MLVHSTSHPQHVHFFAPLHRRHAESDVTCAHASPVLYASTVLNHAACRALLGSYVGVSYHGRPTYRIHPVSLFSPCAPPFDVLLSTWKVTSQFSLFHPCTKSITALLSLALSPHTALPVSHPHLEHRLALFALPAGAPMTFATLPHANHTALCVAP